MEIKAQLTGTDEIIKTQRKIERMFSDRSGRAVSRKALRAAIEPARREIYDRTPVDSGLLKESVYASVKMAQGKLFATAGYQIHRDGWVTVNGRRVRNRGLPKILAVEEGNHIVGPGQHIVRQALGNNYLESQANLLRTFREELNKVIAKGNARARRRSKGRSRRIR